MARQSKDSWDNEYKTYISGISDEDLEAVKAILADDSRTAEDIEFVDKVFENVVFSNMNTVAMEELGTNGSMPMPTGLFRSPRLPGVQGIWL